MHVYSFNNGIWSHDWIETSWQAPSIHNVAGAIDVGTYNQVFYRGIDERCRGYSWEQGFFRSSISSYNYTMNETKPSPTLPGSELRNEFEVVTYPNPVQSELKIKVFAKEADIFKLSLFDFTGRLLAVTDINDFSEKTLNFQYLPSGIFILKIVDSKGNIIVKKIAKE